ncbi:hypothetical protein [Streptomyces sp. ISL-94]|uniref:hypothetical protein n=1 Tax=Streptomyces sp. ISL-94 TaxID=2819190 RepID=UPI0020354132|nr:hypothetical protein [Streptomyces sp. ISL-94]
MAAGMGVRALAGLGWAAGLLDSPPDSPFHALNLVLYPPACLGFGWAAARLALAPAGHHRYGPVRAGRAGRAG